MSGGILPLPRIPQPFLHPPRISADHVDRNTVCGFIMAAWSIETIDSKVRIIRPFVLMLRGRFIFYLPICMCSFLPYSLSIASATIKLISLDLHIIIILPKERSC
jgi:hypothetical protein